MYLISPLVRVTRPTGAVRAGSRIISWTMPLTVSFWSLFRCLMSALYRWEGALYLGPPAPLFWDM